MVKGSVVGLSGPEENQGAEEVPPHPCRELIQVDVVMRSAMQTPGFLLLDLLHIFKIS